MSSGIHNVGVIGIGLMGSGIAQVAARRLASFGVYRKARCSVRYIEVLGFVPERVLVARDKR
jgi:3-hydroxyacyl-CoA dehydrogenase